MKRLLSISALIFSVLLVASPVGASRPLVSPAIMAKATRVAICEEGGNWNYFSYWYPDALGIDRPNWIQFGGSVAKPSSRATQIKIGTKFLRAYHMAMPDQQGYCAPW